MAQAKKTVSTAAKKAPAKKETAKKTTVKKPAAKKTTAAKTAASTLKTKIELQFDGKNYSYDEILTKAKDMWTKELKKSLSDLKSLDLYVKPEESRVYYVANAKEAGSFEL